MLRQFIHRVASVGVSQIARSAAPKTPEALNAKSIDSLCTQINRLSLQSARPFTVLCRSVNLPKQAAEPSLLQSSNVELTPVATYKVKVRLRKRCKHCFYVRRRGRWFIECKEKGRHKQMQKMSRKHLWRED